MENNNTDTNLSLVDINYIYNPRFHLIDLISTRRRPFSSTTRHPPRPPNSFFLMKNCLLLELKHGGYRLTMPALCRMARSIWRDIPQDAKNRYDALAVEAQILHQQVYPNYRFEPKKRTRFKPFVPPSPNNLGINAFSSVTSSPSLESSSSSSSSSSSPITTPQTDVYLPVLPDTSDFGSYNFHNVNAEYGSESLCYTEINFSDYHPHPQQQFYFYY